MIKVICRLVSVIALSRGGTCRQIREEPGRVDLLSEFDTTHRHFSATRYLRRKVQTWGESIAWGLDDAPLASRVDLNAESSRAL